MSPGLQPPGTSSPHLPTAGPELFPNFPGCRLWPSHPRPPFLPAVASWLTFQLVLDVSTLFPPHLIVSCPLYCPCLPVTRTAPTHLAPAVVTSEADPTPRLTACFPE